MKPVFGHTRPKCCNCLPVINALMEQNAKLHKMLMAFNAAGLNLARQEEAMAKLAVEGRRIDLDKSKAEADVERATAQRLEAENGVRPSRYGEHAVRTVIGAGTP